MTRAGLFGAVCVLLLSATARAEVMRSHPLPIRIEGESVRSSAWLRFAVERYDMSLDAFARRAGNDAAEAAFARLMTGLRDRNASRITELVTPASHGGDVAAYIENFHRAFDGFRDVAVVAQAWVGDRRVFVWEVSHPTEHRRWRRGFSFASTEAGTWRGEATSSAAPIENLVLDVLELEGRRPTDYVAGDASTDYELRLGGGAHPVTLQMNGAGADFDPIHDKSSQPSEILRFFGEVWGAFAAGRYDAWADFFVTPSREKILQGWATMSAKQRDDFALLVNRGRQVGFVMNADPVFLVFYAEGSRQDGDLRLARWEFVVRQPDGQLKMANFMRGSYLDHVIETTLPKYAKELFELFERSKRR